MSRVECSFLEQCDIGSQCNFSMLSTGKHPICLTQNLNNLQLLKDKIADCVYKLDCATKNGDGDMYDIAVYNLRQLSAVQ
jgi:hypothetical protein